MKIVNKCEEIAMNPDKVTNLTKDDVYALLQEAEARFEAEPKLIEIKPGQVVVVV